MNKKYPIKKRIAAYTTKAGKWIIAHEKIILISAATAAAAVIATLAIKDAQTKHKLRTDPRILNAYWKQLSKNPSTRKKLEIMAAKTKPKPAVRMWRGRITLPEE
jgi:uncharacterized protein YceH (UPF0502 family)